MKNELLKINHLKKIYHDKKGEIVSGIIQKAEGSALVIDLGKVEGTIDKSTRLKEDMDFFKVN